MSSAGELPRRLAVAVVGIPVVLGALHVGGWVLGVLVALAAALGAHEFFSLARARGAHPFVVPGMVASSAVVLAAVAQPRVDVVGAWAAVGLVVLALVLLGASVWRRWPEGTPLDDVGATVLGVLYTGGALAFVPLLRGLPEALGGSADGLIGASFVLLPLLTTWAGDSAAYFVGSAIGRRKLAPHASPGKSIEGAIAGLVGSVVAAVVVLAWAEGALPGVAPSAAVAAGLGVTLGVAAQIGDLAESVLKRQAGVKDSGKILPGHGGVLDRLDALLFAFPLAYLLLRLPGILG
ncbi:MAG: phosphatidate cytidylyltransferase [Gemmatimonadetes bacterium]|nr:phosphatidate cytidylyltransferase [Gemmatimonadota bacterium]MBT8402562.1 phosphatidate cytidylyltransferase [Gemmatimonadota bacterium]